MSKRTTLLLDGLIREKIACQNIKTILTNTKRVLNKCLLFL